MNRIGYASITEAVLGLNYRLCTLKTLNEDNIRNIITHNLEVLDGVVDYNTENNILLFRISSDIIPFASHEDFPIDYKAEFQEKLLLIGNKIIKNGLRFSMHPGQYTVLNSFNEEVVKRAVQDLEYQTSILDLMGLDSTHKLILHIGGAYGDKASAADNFCNNYMLLADNIKARLIIENDDKSFNINDVLEISKRIKAPVIYDNLHNAINSFDSEKSDYHWLSEASKTWAKKDGTPKMHFSIQDPLKRTGSHSETIYISKFNQFYSSIKDLKVDIMLEVKDKNISAIKCINLVYGSKIGNLEKEWEKYKYSVLEYAPALYLEIRNLLKDKKSYPVLEFYSIIEKALAMAVDIGNSVNALLHVWGYFKNLATSKEKEQFLNLIEKYQKGLVKVTRLKKKLLDFVIKYDSKYLRNSYFFYYNF